MGLSTPSIFPVALSTRVEPERISSPARAAVFVYGLLAQCFSLSHQAAPCPLFHVSQAPPHERRGSSRRHFNGFEVPERILQPISGLSIAFWSPQIVELRPISGFEA